MNLFEALKKPFLYKEPTYKPTSITTDKELEYPIENDNYENIPIGFSDGAIDTNNYYLNQNNQKWISLVKQKMIIESYRKAALTVEVGDGIDDIINDATYTDPKEPIIKLNIDEENEKIKTALTDEFNNITKNVLDLDTNIYSLMEKFYIDGQLNVKLVYNKSKIQEGIKKIDVITPFYFYYDKDQEKWKYLDITLDKRNFITSATVKKEEYSKEEIIRIDSGIYNTEEKLILGWLRRTVKTSNQLSTLEDLLIPMRFSRSVSRRVFNVDVSDLPPTKAKKYLLETKNEFKYKKQYNTETGEVRNNQHITSMVEDYWFANRNGAKGTQVDTIDETGNLGELEDLIYFQKKIFRTMKVPSSRALGEDSAAYGPNNEEITQEEMKFFLFIQRFRNRFMPLIKKLFKRNIISKNILTADEYNDYEEKLNFYFSSENKFFIKMKQMEMQNQADLYSSVKEDIGKVYSYQEIFKNVFNKTEDEMNKLFKEIQKEKSNKLMKDLFVVPDDGY